MPTPDDGQHDRIAALTHCECGFPLPPDREGRIAHIQATHSSKARLMTAPPPQPVVIPEPPPPPAGQQAMF